MGGLGSVSLVFCEWEESGKKVGIEGLQGNHEGGGSRDQGPRV